jgi:hypothetical protein
MIIGAACISAGGGMVSISIGGAGGAAGMAAGGTGGGVSDAIGPGAGGRMAGIDMGAGGAGTAIGAGIATTMRLAGMDPAHAARPSANTIMEARTFALAKKLPDP